MQKVKTKWGKEYKLIHYILLDGSITTSKPRLKTDVKAIKTSGGTILINQVKDYKSLRKAKQL